MPTGSSEPLDELRAARDVLEGMGKQGQAMALSHIVEEIEGVLRSIDRGAARAYPGSVGSVSGQPEHVLHDLPLSIDALPDADVLEIVRDPVGRG